MSDFTVHAFRSPEEATPFLRWLATYRKFFTFDLETYDALKCPGRKGVATDPFNPDFRVRGVAIAYTNTEAAWIELMPWEDEKLRAQALLSPAFASPARKGAFNGQFDEHGLVFPTTGVAWATEVRHRDADGMLAAIALGDVTQDSNTLSATVARVFGGGLTWDGADKSQMRDLPFEDVSRGSGGDAIWTRRLILELHQRAARGEYLPSTGISTLGTSGKKRWR